MKKNFFKCKFDRQNHVLKMIKCPNCLFVYSVYLPCYLFTAFIVVPGFDLGLDKWSVVTLLSHPTHLPVTTLHIDDCPFP